MEGPRTGRKRNKWSQIAGRKDRIMEGECNVKRNKKKKKREKQQYTQRLMF